MNTESETSRTAEEKTRDLRQEFSELPFERKIATLMQLETVAATEAFDKIAKATAALGKKIFDNVMSDDPVQPDEHTRPERKSQSEPDSSIMTTDQTPAPNEPLEIRFLALALILIGPLMLIGCPSRSNKPAEGPAPPSASSAPAKSAFDGDRAFEQVRKQVEFGPRPAGSAELEKTRGYMIEQLKSYGLNVTTDEFRATTPIGERKMVNVTAELPGESNDVVIISSHYDTKYFKNIKFVGANDGGSSTGALMEIARVMAANKQKPKTTYWFVFFDGEEAFCFDWTNVTTRTLPIRKILYRITPTAVVDTWLS